MSLIETRSTTDESGEAAALLDEAPDFAERMDCWRTYALDAPGLSPDELRHFMRPLDALEAAAALAARFPGCAFALAEVHSVLVSAGGQTDARRRCRIEGRVGGRGITAEAKHWEGALAQLVKEAKVNHES